MSVFCLLFWRRSASVPSTVKYFLNIDVKHLQAGLKQCLADFRRNLPWVERLDLTNGPVADIVAKADGKTSMEDRGEINAEDDFQREMHL